MADGYASLSIFLIWPVLSPNQREGVIVFRLVTTPTEGEGGTFSSLPPKKMGVFPLFYIKIYQDIYVSTLNS